MKPLSERLEDFNYLGLAIVLTVLGLPCWLWWWSDTPHLIPPKPAVTELNLVLEGEVSGDLADSRLRLDFPELPMRWERPMVELMVDERRYRVEVKERGGVEASYCQVRVVKSGPDLELEKVFFEGNQTVELPPLEL